MMAIIIAKTWTLFLHVPPLGIAFATFLLAYLLFEVGFFFHYHWNLLPRANRIRTSEPPANYRDYPQHSDRADLLCRIIHRLRTRIPANIDGVNAGPSDNTKSENGPTTMATNAADVIYKFIESWFQKRKKIDPSYERFSEQFDKAAFSGFGPPPLRMAWSSSLGNVSADDGTKSSNDDSVVTLSEELPPSQRNGGEFDDDNRQEFTKTTKNSVIVTTKDKLQKENMDEFFSWAFFGMHHTTVLSTPSMKNALDHFYEILKTEVGLTFEPGKNPNYSPRCFTFECVNSLYRPYAVYAAIGLMRWSASCVLWALGFQQYACKRGLKYWHRSASRKGTEMPFLFFHGIAPGGHAPYLPMIFKGLLRDGYQDRDIFLFENMPISYSLCFDALSEEDTVHGVVEAIHRHLEPTSFAANNLSLCGHSFGSCQLTWMVQCPQIRSRIRSLIFLDPVSILLSEPDVMINFLYNRQESDDSFGSHRSGLVERIIRFLNESKIHLVASSELFIEHYLRRNFAWYNSELWLADIPDDVKVLVCLAELDEIVNSRKIEREVSLHNSQKRKANENKDSGLGGDGRSRGPLVESIMWKGVGHAHCMTNPGRWAEVFDAMNAMESQILKEKSVRS